MPPNTIISTAFLLPTSVISNGEVTGNGFNNPNNILLVDGDVASSNSSGASDITIGNFNTNLPQNAVITGIEMQLIAYRGAQTNPQITITPYLYDNTDGANDYYPYITPFTGLTTALASYTLGTSTYLFASSFTVDQINNLKMNLVVNGDVSIDSFLIKVYYYLQVDGAPVTPVVSNCDDCDSVIQVPEMYLALPFLSGQTKFYLQPGSFSYADGTPVQPGDVGACGGEVNFVFDEGKRKQAGQNFEENVLLDVSTGSWTVLPSGIIEVDIVNVTNRGIEPKTPYGHNANLMSDHDANSKVVISNSGRFYLRFVRRCEAGNTFSEPIEVMEDGAQVVYPTTKFNFLGNGVQVQQDGTDPEQANITIPGGGTGTPVIDSTSSSTSEDQQVANASWQHTCSGVNRLLTVQIAMEEGITVTALTYNSIAMNFVIADELNGTRVEIWQLVAPSLGTHDIDVTFSAPSYYSGGGVSLVGVDQASPIGATNSATGTDLNPTLGLNTTIDNSVIIDGLCTALTPILLTPGAGQVENWHEYANIVARQGASSYEVAGSAPDAITMDYAITQNTDWTLCAIEVKGITTASSTLEVEDEGISIDASVTKMNFVGAGVTVTQTAPGEVEVNIPGGGGGGGGGGNYFVDQTPDNGTYGLLSGSVDGINDTFTVSQNEYISGSLIVYLNGVAQEQGATEDFIELDPLTGTIQFNTPPVTNDIITVQYQTPAGSGGDSQKKVGVGEITDIAWHNFQYLFAGDYVSSSVFDIWDLTNASPSSPSHVSLGAGQYITPNNNDYNSFFPDFTIGDYSFNSNKQLIFQITAYTQTTANENCGIGFDVFGAAPANKIFAQQGTNTVGVGFIRTGSGDWYARCANGASFTETPIAVSLDVAHVFRVEYDPGNAIPQARFYVDGALVATITTNVPAAVASITAFTVGNDGGCTTLTVVGCPAFSVEI